MSNIKMTMVLRITDEGTAIMQLDADHLRAFLQDFKTIVSLQSPHIGADQLPLIYQLEAEVVAALKNKLQPSLDILGFRAVDDNIKDEEEEAKPKRVGR